jgi:hypothetical protein
MNHIDNSEGKQVELLISYSDEGSSSSSSTTDEVAQPPTVWDTLMYCMKCRKRTLTKDAEIHTIATKKGRRTKARGVCIECGKVKSTFIRSGITDVARY